MLIALRIGLFIGSLCIAVALPANAGGKDCKRSQDCALGAREQGKIRSLSEVLAAVRAVAPGEIVEIELEREDGVWVYEIKIIVASGRRRTVEINAETLAIIKVE